ncbi:DUF6714 family protein [Okeanomitos corallinicola TIOX110]|uniref:DUF6714 family protein n=1 Tax=Okeanomitos corallinicola TIOX110 TaxID=3133117 RepID=A0ABZ2UM53_9CYAN
MNPFSFNQKHSEVTLEYLKAQIEQAFAGVEFPGDDHLSDTYDQSEIEDFQGNNWQHWNQIDCYLVNKNYSSLVFLTPEAFRFFLPIYIMCGLEHPSSNTLEFTVYSLILRNNSDDPELSKLCLSWFNILNSEQKKAVVLFLKYVRSKSEYGISDSASEALQSYWLHTQ